jgi:hypothetical protein
MTSGRRNLAKADNASNKDTVRFEQGSITQRFKRWVKRPSGDGRVIEFGCMSCPGRDS